jgi:hypothetical protein
LRLLQARWLVALVLIVGVDILEFQLSIEDEF